MGSSRPTIQFSCSARHPTQPPTPGACAVCSARNRSSCVRQVLQNGGATAAVMSESKMGAVTWGFEPTSRFPPPLIEPYRRYERSDALPVAKPALPERSKPEAQPDRGIDIVALEKAEGQSTI